jgi:hypothetical protein
MEKSNAGCEVSDELHIYKTQQQQQQEPSFFLSQHARKG